MVELAQQSAPTGCPVPMSDGKPCGRQIHPAPSDVDKQPVCLMHSRDQRKDAKAFRGAIDAILLRTSVFHRPQDHFDFRYFVFHETNFRGVTFAEKAFFGEASFIQEADFSGATFTQEANFGVAMFSDWTNFGKTRFIKEAIFTGAKFIQGASFVMTTFSQGAFFWGAEFTQRADFSIATFSHGADFRGATFANIASFDGAIFGRRASEDIDVSSSAIADFRFAKFLMPNEVIFSQANQEGHEKLRVRFVGCSTETVRFEDVNWHRENGRMVLQDELDLRANLEEASRHEQIAIAYRRLINNFEKSRSYDLAEDCAIGLMEMKRLDPAKFLFAGRLGPCYEKWPWLRWVGEHVSVTNLYRLASNYGSSYVRAFGVLALLLLAFALLFTLSGVSPNPSRNAGALAPAGLIHAVEVVTFQSPTRYVAGNGLGWMLEQVERLLVAAQVALFLLALRRRFRR